MNLEELEHAIRASCDITGDTEVYVFGSQTSGSTARSFSVRAWPAIETYVSDPEEFDSHAGKSGAGW